MEEQPGQAAIRWKCRRGMLELDMLLERFVARHYAGLDRKGRRDLIALLDAEDDLLWDYLTGRVVPEAKGIARLVERIRDPN